MPKFKKSTPGNFQKIKLLSSLTLELNRVAKELGEESVYEALTDDSKMESFAKKVISSLPMHLKSSFSIEKLIPIIMDNKKQLLKKRKNKKLIKDHEHKNNLNKK